MKTTTWAKTSSSANFGGGCSALRRLLLGLVFLAMPTLSFAQVPLIQQLKPPSVAPGGADLTLNVYGANFTSTSTVNFNGSAVTTTFVSDNHLTAKVLAAQTASPGTAIITVSSPGVQICIIPTCPPNPSITVIPASSSNAALFPIANAPATVNFATLPSIMVGAGAQSVAVGQFTSSGFFDLAVVSSGTNQATVLLGNGHGGFTAKGPFTTGHNPQSVALGDFNHDGNLDMAVANENDNNVSVFLGDGLGGFSAPKTYGLQAGVGPVALTAADLDGDGNLDLAVVNGLDQSCPTKGQGAVAYLQGVGDGTFTTFATTTYLGSVVPGTLGPTCLDVPASSIVSGLFNLGGPGMPDLVVNNGDFVGAGCPLGDGTVTVLTNQFQSGTANPGQPFAGLAFGTNSFCVGKTPSGMAVGDFDLDGKLDLAIADSGDNAVTILMGNGDGTFKASPNSYLTNGLGPIGVAVGDFNADQKDDLIVANQGSDAVSLLVGNGDGTFGPALPFTTLDASSNGHGPVSVVAADFNGDGLLEVATADTGDGFVSTLLQGVGVSFSSQKLDFTPSPNPGQPIGTTSSSPLSVTVTGGTIPFTLTGLTLTGPSASDFSIDPSTTCKPGVTVLTSPQTCVAAVNFTPSEPEERQAVLQFALNNSTLALSISQSVAVQGNALAQPIQLAPTNLNLGQVLVGTAAMGTCTPATNSSCVTLQNVGANPLTVSGIINTDTAEFQLNDPNGCKTKTFQPNDSCQFSVTFSPLKPGLRTDAFTISANLSGLAFFSQLLPVAGDGLAPQVSLSAGSLSFPFQQVGTSSAIETVVVTNIGTADLTFASILISPASPDYQVVTPPLPQVDCRSLSSLKLPLSSSCSIGIQFTPSFKNPALGPRSGILLFTDNNNAVSGSLQMVVLGGTATYPVVSLSAAAVALGGVPIGTTSAPQSFTLFNAGTAPLDIGGGLGNGIYNSNTGEFTETDNCPRSPVQLAVNTFCTITVTLKPSAIGARGATLTITDDNLGSLLSPALTQNQMVTLSGTGTDFTLSAAPASITITPSKTATYKITLNPIDGFNNAVTFSCAGGPPHSNCFISGVSNGSASVILSTSQGVNKGTFTLTFYATYTAVAPASGVLQHSTTAKVTVK